MSSSSSLFTHVPARTYIVQFTAIKPNMHTFKFVLNLPRPPTFAEEQDIIKVFEKHHDIEITAWSTLELPTFFNPVSFVY